MPVTGGMGLIGKLPLMGAFDKHPTVRIGGRYRFAHRPVTGTVRQFVPVIFLPLQEIIRMILEAIYEPTFSDRSHGFRPKRSCHTALSQIKDTFSFPVW